MRVVVTGAGGYIGSTLVEMLLDKGHKVIGLDRFFFGEEILGDTILKNPDFHLLKKDIRDCELSDFIGVDAVCDLAALSNDPSGDLDPSLTNSINNKARVRVSKLAKSAGVKRYVLASSCSVYGDGKGGVLSETTAPNPLTQYAQANYEAEQGVFGLSSLDYCVTALRQATVYGLSKRMRFDLVINIMTLNAVQSGVIHILGGGTQWRPLIHVRDTARAFIVVLEADPKIVRNEVFNVGSSQQNFQVKNLAYIVRESLPFQVSINMAPSDDDKRDYHVSFEKIKKSLDFELEYTPEFAVREIYDALKMGIVDTGIKTSTVKWYKHLMESKMTLDSIILNGRLL